MYLVNESLDFGCKLTNILLEHYDNTSCFLEVLLLDYFLGRIDILRNPPIFGSQRRMTAEASRAARLLATNCQPFHAAGAKLVMPMLIGGGQALAGQLGSRGPDDEQSGER